MEERQKLEIGNRIKELRDASPHTNRSIADAVDRSERGVAKWIQGKGISYDSAARVADLFEVDRNWLWTGTAKGETADLMGKLNSATRRSAELDAVEELRTELAAVETKLLARLAEVQDALQGEQQTRKPRGRTRGQTGS